MKNRLRLPAMLTTAATARDYLVAALGEMRRVSWPDRPLVARYTVLTLATITASIIAIAGIDYILRLLSQTFLIR